MTTGVRISHLGGIHNIVIVEVPKNAQADGFEMPVTVLKDKGDEHVCYVHENHSFVITEEVK